MSTNREDKDIEEPHWCHALLLLYTPPPHASDQTARARILQHASETPRIIVALSWGLPAPALLEKQLLYPLSFPCLRRYASHLDPVGHQGYATADPACACYGEGRERGWLRA